MAHHEGSREPITTVGGAAGLPEGVTLENLFETLERIRAGVSRDVGQAAKGERPRAGDERRSDPVGRRISELERETRETETHQHFIDGVSKYFELFAGRGDIKFLIIALPKEIQRLKKELGRLYAQQTRLLQALRASGRSPEQDDVYKNLNNEIVELKRLIAQAVAGGREALAGITVNREAEMNAIDAELKNSDEFAKTRERLGDLELDMNELFRNAAALQTRNENDGRTPLERVLIYIDRLRDQKLREPKYRPTTARVDSALSMLVQLVTEQYPVATFQKGQDRQPAQLHAHPCAGRLRGALGKGIRLGIVEDTLGQARDGLKAVLELQSAAAYHTFVEKYLKPGALEPGHSLVALQEIARRADGSSFKRVIGAMVTRADGSAVSFALIGRRTAQDVANLEKNNRLSQSVIKKRPMPAAVGTSSDAPTVKRPEVVKEEGAEAVTKDAGAPEDSE